MSRNWSAANVGRSRGAQIARNALSGVGARLGMMVVGFALTPFIVHHLGLRLFGLWSLTASVSAYLGLLDFGLAGVFVKFITEYVEGGRRDLARQVVTFGALFYAAVGVALALPVVLLAPLVTRTLGLPPAEMHTAIAVFEALALLMVLSLIAGIPGSVIVGMQRMEVASRNTVLAYLVSAVVTVTLLRAGWVLMLVSTSSLLCLMAASLKTNASQRVRGQHVG